MRFVFPAVFSVMMLFVSFYAEALKSHNPLQAVTATAADARDVRPEHKLAAVAAISGPAPDVTPEPKLDAARKAQLAPEVLPKVNPRRVRQSHQRATHYPRRMLRRFLYRRLPLARPITRLCSSTATK